MLAELILSYQTGPGLNPAEHAANEQPLTSFGTPSQTRPGLNPAEHAANEQPLTAFCARGRPLLEHQISIGRMPNEHPRSSRWRTHLPEPLRIKQILRAQMTRCDPGIDRYRRSPFCGSAAGRERSARQVGPQPWTAKLQVCMFWQR